MTSLSRRAALLLALLLAVSVPARAVEFDLPGLDMEADGFVSDLSRPFPAGGTATGRRDSEARAAAAEGRGDWTAAAKSLEARLGQGEEGTELWLRLSRAELKRIPSDPRRALESAWHAYYIANTPADRASAMIATAQALLAQGRPAQAGQAFARAVELAPDNNDYRRMLTEANQAAGLLVLRVDTEADADPPRACIVFNVPLSRRNDVHAEDWVRLDPPVPDAAITREGDGLCVSGLPLAATTRAILRAGMPGEGGIALKSEATTALALGNRTPLLAFDNRMFLLPHGQAPRIVLSSSNVSAVKIEVVLFTERTMLPWTIEHRLGQTIDDLPGSGEARVVWSGTAALPGFSTNARMHTVLPLPAEAMAEPGLYAVTVQPDDGQSIYGTHAVQPVLRTDLAPTVWRGGDGLTVQLRGYSDARPRPGTTLRLMAHDNDILAQAQTDADGMARFAAPLLHGEGAMAPSAVQGLSGEDFVSLDLDAAAFDLSDRGVTGAKQPGPLDAFAWTDRGIYRPGETVQVMALLRDAGGQPVDRPAHVRIKRPNGTVFSDGVVQPGGGGSLHLTVALSNGAAAGGWLVEVLADPKGEPVGEAAFKVDAFVPDRMAVQLGALPAQLAPGRTEQVAVDARFLYGAPAAHLAGQAEMRLGIAPLPPPALAGYQVGLADEAFAPDAMTVVLPATDDAGHAVLPLRLAASPDSTHPVQAALDVSVDDPSGHSVHAAATVPVRPAGPLIGIRPAFPDGSVDAGAEAAFDIAAIDPDGARIALPVRVRLVRERPEWRLVLSGALSSYETVWRDEPLETHDLDIPASGTLRFARTLDFGRYRLEVAQPRGLAAASVRFRSGWATSDSPDVPDRADVSADRRSYAPGDVARIHVAAPFAGPATLLVMTDRVLSSRDVDVPAAGADFDVPVDAAWGPGAYVALHVFRGGGGGGGARPDRAIGLAWLGIDPASRRLDVSFDAPESVAPRATAHVTLHTAPGAWVSVAAVDEGILRLTGFATPDAGPHYFGRRALGVDIRDDWGRLIAPAEGTAAALRQGGDESAFGRPGIPQQVVSLFVAPVQADASGAVDVALPFPDFSGQVRLMAMAWDGNRLGSAGTDLFVRDPLIAEPLLPRFLAPGDSARVAVLLHNLSLPGGTVSVRVTTDGPLAVDGGTLDVPLAQGAQAVPTLALRATGAGPGHVRLDVSGPGGFHVVHEAALDVHATRGRHVLVSDGELPAGGTMALAPHTDAFVPGTWTASATFGAPVRYDAGALVRSLDDYPLLCLEQATSKGFPLTVLADGDIAGPDRAIRLQHAVDTVLDRQRYDGAFGLWAAFDEAEPWLSLYATEFLLRARKAGANVSEAAMADALKSVSEGIAESRSDAEGRALQAYRLYVAALAGEPRAGAGRVLFETLDDLPTPLSRAQLGAALAMGNDRPRAERAFAAALAAPGRKRWDYDYGDATRDAAGVAMLLKESGVLAERLPDALARLPGADARPGSLDTQDEAWLAAAAAVLGRDGAVTRVSLDDRALSPAPVVTASLGGPATARNTGERAVWQSVSASGVLAQAPGAARAGMRITRRFFATDGSVLDLSRLRQNTVFVMLLEGAAEDGQAHRAQLLQGLPAGWEIAALLPPGSAAGMAWLGTLSETEATPAADDRYQAVLPLTTDAPSFRVAVRLRAVTTGNFEIPGAELSDMYQPAIQARQGSNRVDVLPPG